MSSGGRFWFMVMLLVGATIGLHTLSHGEEVTLAEPLGRFPSALENWEGRELPVEEWAIEAVGVEDHLSRVYQGPDGQPLFLYVGYYKTQRTGQAIHSPKNCLPGAGWQPVSASRVELPLPDGQRALVNLYLIEKGLDRQLVLYWYQSHGRIIASEYWGKIYMVLDAVRLNRTDSALVRISTPVYSNEEEARRRAVTFAERALIELQYLIPR